MNKLFFNLSNASLGKYILGSAVPKEFNNESFLCYEHGYTISIYNGKISAILVCFRSGYMNFDKFLGGVFFNKNMYYLNVNTTFDEAKNIFGEPVDQWNDGVEKCAMYEHNGNEIEIIWHVDDITTLDYISIEMI